MDYNCIVDCHMHVLTKEDFNLYMKTACADKYINIRGLYIDENGLNKFSNKNVLGISKILCK